MTLCERREDGAHLRVRIGERWIGPGERPLLIAEAGVNHNGDVDLALRLVDASAEAGADAVKFQTFSADRLVSRGAPKAAYQRETTDPGESQRDMLRRLELSASAHRQLRSRCAERGVVFLSTPFDVESADLLDDLGVPAFKLGSGEVTNLPLLEHVARKGKPILLSTGMSYLGEVERAALTIRAAGNDALVLLHCVSAYPADPSDANLRAIATLGAAFGVPVGWSDHTPGIEVSLAAAALGACVIEKHVTLDKELPGPDHRASLEPAELRALRSGLDVVARALGDGAKRPMPSESDTRSVARRSLAAAIVIETGTTITKELLRSLRPASGISPALLDEVVGRRARRRIEPDELLAWSDLE